MNGRPCTYVQTVPFLIIHKRMILPAQKSALKTAFTYKYARGQNEGWILCQGCINLCQEPLVRSVDDLATFRNGLSAAVVTPSNGCRGGVVFIHHTGQM